MCPMPAHASVLRPCLAAGILYKCARLAGLRMSCVRKGAHHGFLLPVPDGRAALWLEQPCFAPGQTLGESPHERLEPFPTRPDATTGASGRRGGRVVEGARLERVCTGNRTEGSNPSLSASFKRKALLNVNGALFSTFAVKPVLRKTRGAYNSPVLQKVRNSGLNKSVYRLSCSHGSLCIHSPFRLHL